MAKPQEKGAEKYTILEEDDVPGAKLNKVPEKCIVDELKRWLECHSLKKSGKKDELVKRVEDALKLNLPVNPKIDGGKWYDIKVNKGGSTTAPSNLEATTSDSSDQSIPCDEWRLFPSRNIPPNFNYGHVYFYLVESVASAANIIDTSDSDDDQYNTCDTVTAKPLKKGRNLLKSGFIENLQDNFDEVKQEFYVRAHVQHSMKNMLPLNVFVVISNVSGYVKTAKCDCKASALGRCAHVAAILLNLSNLVSASDTITIQPSTSQPCSWNKGKKREKKPKKLHNAEYAGSKRKPPSGLYTWDPRPEKLRSVSDEDVRKFVVNLQSDSKKTMWESVLPITYENFQLEPADVEIYQNLTLQFIAGFEKQNNSILGTNTCCQIPDTQDQAESDRWHLERRFRITASICKSIVNMGENLSQHDSLHPHFTFLEKFWSPSNVSTFDMEYGKKNEANALQKYGEIKNILVGLSGLWINKKYIHLGASPDGLIFKDGMLEGILEVKCLKILRLHSVADVINNECSSVEVKRQCFDVVDGKLLLKKKHMYYFQIQLQLLITEAKYCDFVLFSNKGPLSIERINPDVELQSRIVNSTQLFWEKVYLPEYFLMRVPRGLLPLVI